MSSIADEEDRARLEREEQIFNGLNYTAKYTFPAWCPLEVYDE